MIVTIDGPAGAGKSTIARRVAQRLGFRYLDTGSMYRAVALAASRRRVDWDDPTAVAAVARSIRVEVDLQTGRTLLDSEDVTDAVRSSEVTAVTRFAADNPDVRALMVQKQRQIARSNDIVTEGRDQGSVVFPEAQCKIFLTASAEERARRRLRQCEAQGETADFEAILGGILDRDARDAARSVGPLVEPPDAVRVQTDGLTIDEVVQQVESLARQVKCSVRPEFSENTEE